MLLFGNGGSAADAQHIAAEFVGRFVPDRRALPAISLATDTSALTALGNDYGYNFVFSRQVEALGVSGDVAIGISTSGNSPNVIAALDAARAKGMLTIGFTGEGGGKMVSHTDILFCVPSKVHAADSGDASDAGPHHLRAGRPGALSGSVGTKSQSNGLTVESAYPIQPLDLDRVSTYPLADRKSKVHSGIVRQTARRLRLDSRVHFKTSTNPRSGKPAHSDSGNSLCARHQQTHHLGHGWTRH